MPNPDNVYTAKSLVDENILLEVPIYQRLFVWDEVQILTLLDDIYDAYQKKNPNYYIGIVTVVDHRETDAPPRWELVDGQQRLTFLTLLGTQVKWDAFIASTEGASVPRINYVGRNKDQDCIKALRAGRPDACMNPNLLRFLKCYEEFQEKHRADDLSGFADYAYSKTAFLVSKLFPGYSPFELNTYFEKLNSTGRQLEPEELVKGLYFSSRAAEWNTLCEFSKPCSSQGFDTNALAPEAASSIRTILESDLAERNAKLLEEPAAVSQPKSSVRSILSLPVFLLHVLSLLREGGVEMNPRKLVQIFKDHAPRTEDEKNQFMKHMRQYREWLDKNIVHHTEAGLEFWRDMNDETEETTTDRKSLRQFQSMLAVSSSEQQRWVLEAYRNASGKNLGDADFLTQLKGEDRARNPVDDADAFKAALRYPAINRYWFWRLDYLLWELYQNSPASDLFSGLESGEKAAISAYRFKANRSIEHVHPQTSTEPWAEEDLHAFGNLAMISASFNSTQSNDGVGTKFGRVKDQIANRGALESIKMLLMFKAADRSEANWSEETANMHGAAMVARLLEAFCHHSANQ